jgi:hypothetical protein
LLISDNALLTKEETQMAYVRPVKEKRKDPHPLETEFGFFHQLSMQLDNGWEQNFLADLHDEARLFLSQINSVLDHVKSQDFSDYRKEVADKKKANLIRKSREILLSSLKRHIDDARSNVEAVKNKILRVTENPEISDINKNIERLFLQREIRDEIKLTDPKDRNAMIAGNLEMIRACLSSPVPLLSPEHLERLRVEYAFQIDPSLEIEAKDSRLQYRKTRERAGEINGTAKMMLVNTKIEDPISPEEHFAVFVPDNEYDQVLADKQILSYSREQEKQRRQKQFDDSHPGVNLGGEAIDPERRLKQVRG